MDTRLDSKKTELKIGDVIQITDSSNPLYGRLAEIKGSCGGKFGGRVNLSLIAYVGVSNCSMYANNLTKIS